MTDEVVHVYLRLSAGARHSQVDFERIESLAGGPGTVTIRPDSRDGSVYSFALPRDADPAQAVRIVSALAATPHIDEVWHETVPVLRN